MLSVYSTLARTAARALPSTATTATRGLAMKVREDVPELPYNFDMDAITPPPSMAYGEAQEETKDPMAYVRKPVTSAHAMDLTQECASALDSAAFGPGGTVVHGRFGAVAAATVPLEYLALLRPAAEGAAALRELAAASNVPSAPGTLLVYGASRPAGLTVAQLGAAAGHAVVAVVDGQHSGDRELVDAVKGLVREPGTAVSQEYALCKANFRELVRRTVAGDDFTAFDAASGPAEFLADFQANLLDYVEAYPSDLPAAVDEEQMRFVGKEKDRANFKTNMHAYLSQFQQGADPVDPTQLDVNFTVDKYQVFKQQFGIQTTAVISGGDGKTDTDRFAPGEIVNTLCAQPEVPAAPRAQGEYPFEFSITQGPAPTTPTLKGGPIVGAVLEVTPDLKAACEALAAAPTLRGRAEALQFLPEAQRTAHAAAASVAASAREAGAPVRTVGGALPGLDEIGPPSEADVRTAVEAMALGDDGESTLNYFVQVYRASDYPVYEDYALFRAKEPLSGPRAIVVTK